MTKKLTKIGKLGFHLFQSEYEECINIILGGQRELAYLTRKLAERVSGPPTIR